MADQRVQYVGDTRISNVWFRIIERPPSLIGYNNLNIDYHQQMYNQPDGQPLGVYSFDDAKFISNSYNVWLRFRYYRTYRGRQLKTQEGRLEDPEFLDLITKWDSVHTHCSHTLFSDIRHGMVGARGWKADYAILVTWERMTYKWHWN